MGVGVKLGRCVRVCREGRTVEYRNKIGGRTQTRDTVDGKWTRREKRR